MSREVARQVHKLAVDITIREGKKNQVNIANVKEILKVLCTMMAEESFHLKDVSPTYRTLDAYVEDIEAKLAHIDRLHRQKIKR